MSRPRLLFLTDDREGYAEGNYYLAYQRAFLRHAEVTLGHPLAPLPALGRFDLIVLGHAAIDNYVRVRGSRLLPGRVYRRLQQLWIRHANLRALRATRVPIVVFTKNDYKLLEAKSSFIRFVSPRLVITHTKSALDHLARPERGRTIWLPFGVDTGQFTPPATERMRTFDVGFRANSNSEWNDGERERFYRALRRLENERPVSLTLSKHGEGFLVGEPYVDWIRSCTLLGNTVSAAGTVGPRFLEAMACGTVPLAPRNRYEDLLVADTHYVPADTGDGSFPALEGAVTRFFEDAAYRAQLRDAGRALVEAHSVDRHVIQVCREAGV